MPLTGVLLALQLATSTPTGAAVGDCLPDGTGFLKMRLRGGIDSEVDWRGAAVGCSGMLRPDGQGLRLQFTGRLAGGGELAVVFAMPTLGRERAGHDVPVNITLFDRQGEHVYATRGEQRCRLDRVEQQPLTDAGMSRSAIRISARGFCTEPARALDGDGSVLLTRFDFAGLLTLADEPGNLPPTLAHLPREPLTVTTAAGRHEFRVWIADTDAARARGLMFVRALPADAGMLFLFDAPQYASFWMKNTFIPLDIVFIGADGRVVNVAENTQPLSLSPIRSTGLVTTVLELSGGTASRIGIGIGDHVEHRFSAGPRPIR